MPGIFFVVANFTKLNDRRTKNDNPVIAVS